MAKKKLEGNMYNEQLKKRFINQSGWGEDFVASAEVMFLRAARLEESLNKDMYEFTAQEASDLLYLLQLKSKGHVMMVVSMFTKYVAWTYAENISTNPVNYFSSLFNSDNANDYVSNVARQTRLISKELLHKYESKLTSIGDYVDAALLRGCFLGLRGSKFKELLGLTINMIKPNAIELETRSIPITDYEKMLFVSAHNQPEMVSLKKEGRRPLRPLYLDCEYIFKATNALRPIGYTSFSVKVAAVGEYVEHFNLTPTNLYFSGMIDALNTMMDNDNTDAEVVFGGSSQVYFEKLKEQFGYEGESRYLKYRLQDYYVGV